MSALSSLSNGLENMKTTTIEFHSWPFHIYVWEKEHGYYITLAGGALIVAPNLLYARPPSGWSLKSNPSIESAEKIYALASDSNLCSAMADLYQLETKPTHCDYIGMEEIDNILNNPFLVNIDPRIEFDVKKYISSHRILKEKGWVYVIGNDEFGLYKIGMTTRTPDERLKEFVPKLPFETTIIATIPTLKPMELEAQLHNKYKDKRTNGEWFELSEGDVMYIRSMSL